MLQKTGETPNPNFAGNQKKEIKPKFEMAAAKKDSHPYERRKPRHIKGALENPNQPPEQFQLNEVTVDTLKTVLFREYKYCDQMVKTYATALSPVMEKVRLGQALTAMDEGIINSAGLRLDQFQFYIDFRSEGKSAQLDTDALILTRADEWRQRDDRLLRALQLAEDQLAVFQAVANADVASRNVKPKRTPYETDGPHIFGDEDKPVTMADLKKRTNVVKRVLQNTQQQLNEWAPGLVEPNSEALLRRGVQSREGVQKLINESDPHYYYDGVKFHRAVNGQVQLVTRGPVQLNAVTAYERFLLQAEQVPQVLLSTREMKQYEKHITDLVDARIDIYRNISDREHIEPRLFSLRVDPTNPNRMVLYRDTVQNITDIEREFTGDPTAQRVQLQERIRKQTQDELRKKQEEAQKTARNEWLGEHVKQWKRELGEDTPQRQEKIKEDKKVKQDQIDKANETKKRSDKKEQIEGKLKETSEQLKEITDRTGLTVAEIEEYDKKTRDVSARESDIQGEREDVSLWQAELDSIASKIPNVVNINASTGQQTVSQDTTSSFYGRAETLRSSISAANDRIFAAQQNIRQFKKDKLAIVAGHSGQGLTEAEMESAYKVWKNNKQAEAEKAGLTALVGAGNYGGIPTSESVQKEIEAFTRQRDAIGRDRIEDDVVEMLDTFEKTRLDETGRNTRLQQHELGKLEGIPDFPHLAGYPRVYLRTIQILFPEVSFAPDKQADLMKFMKLFPPEDFVRIAGPAMGIPARMQHMYHPVWTASQDVLMSRINSELLNNIMDDLSNRIRRKDLGLTAPEKAVYETNVKIRNTYEAKPISTGAKDRMRQVPSFQTDIRDLAEEMYYYESVEDLARRWLIFTGRTFSPNRMRHAYFIAEEVIQYRKEHPNI